MKNPELTDSAAARSGAAPQLKKGDEMHEDDPSRVGPAVPCVAPTGSTAEPRTGAVTAAERPETALIALAEKRSGEWLKEATKHAESWAAEGGHLAGPDPECGVCDEYFGMAALLSDLAKELAALAAARLAVQQQVEQGERIFEAVVHTYEGDDQLVAEDLREASFVKRARKHREAAEAARTALRHDLQALPRYVFMGTDEHGDERIERDDAGGDWIKARDLADRLAREETK